MTIRWLEWGDEAFARARAARKPVLLSLTARWCHACHRMDEETWDDPGVAAAVERSTVPVRVDADARPDIYGRYHLGGLPTTALLTPEAGFVRGATFLLPPQFFAFLGTALGDFSVGRQPAARATLAPASPDRIVDEFIAHLWRRVDPEHGGFGVAPKQPEVHALQLLLRRCRDARDAEIERVVRAALDAILAHLSDPRDGGFFRYGAGADWSGPHTEKLSVDQAQLAHVLMEAASVLGEARYLDSAREALAHARRRLSDESGRVFASVAADPEYYAGARDEPPAVDRRRFADANAAMVAAGWLESAFTGEPSGFQPEFRLAAADGVVPHRLDARDGIAGCLMDQALAISATLHEYRLTGDPGLLDWAARAADQSLVRLWNDEAGAFSAAPAFDHLELPPMFPLMANGQMALALTDLAAHARRAEYEHHARRLIATLGPQAVRSPAGAAIALAAQRLENGPAEADLDGDPGDPRARRLARIVVAALGPAALVRWTGRGHPSITLCARELCLPALEEPEELLHALVDVDLVRSGILASIRFTG